MSTEDGPASMSAICVITARGGSKRIPRKNVKEFCGKPILAYSIEAALASELFDVVMVSTDDADIAQVAKSYGAEVPFLRTERNSDDYATTADVIAEVLDAYKVRGAIFETVCCIYPTAPFVTKDKLSECAGLLTGAADAVVPVVRYSFPPQRGFEVEDGYVEYCHPEYRLTRSQDLKPIFHDAGQFYFCRVAAFNQYGTLVPPRSVPFYLEETECQDIDNESDWKLAELKYRAMLDRASAAV